MKGPIRSLELGDTIKRHRAMTYIWDVVKIFQDKADKNIFMLRAYTDEKYIDELTIETNSMDKARQMAVEILNIMPNWEG